MPYAPHRTVLPPPARRNSPRATTPTTGIIPIMDPHQPDLATLVHRGQTYARRLDFDRALEAFTGAIDLDPVDPDLYYQRGNAHAAAGQTDLATEDFTTAIRTCLTKYADFSGRARRSEFWYFVLFNVVASLVAGVVDNILGTDMGTGTGVVGGLVALALVVPYLAVSVRRLHDTSRTGWLILIGLVPLVGWIILIVWYAQDSHPDNEHGPSPKAQPATA